jgi:beta-lactamase class A
MTLTRRAALTGFSAVLATMAKAQPTATWHADAALRLARIEQRSGGRLGVAALDSATEQVLRHRAGERFPMCSTFKLLAAAFVLARVDAGQERLDRVVSFSKSDLVSYSPATQAFAGKGGMTLGALCEAAITLSDNTAANLLLASFGGPAGLTAFARSLGDETTRLDRTEPTLNEAIPGDPRDTTTPAAMLETMRVLLLRDGLSSASREQLIRWLRGNKVGDHRLRAGVGRDWTVGDKTGTGANGTANDIGVLWPPNRAPILVTVYLTQSTVSDAAREAVIADVGGLIAGRAG